MPQTPHPLMPKMQIKYVQEERVYHHLAKTPKRDIHSLRQSSQHLTLGSSGTSDLKVRDGSTEVVAVVLVKSGALTIKGNHIDGSLSGQAVHVDTSRTLDRHHIVLAACGIKANLAVVVKETVETSAIDEDVIRINNSETPCLIDSRATGEGRIRVKCLGSEGCSGVRVALKVGCLRLNESHVYVRRIGNLVIIQNVML